MTPQTGVASSQFQWSPRLERSRRAGRRAGGATVDARNERERPHASSKRGHSDVVSLPDQRTHGGRRSAERGSPAAGSRRARPVSQPDLEHQQRRQESRRDHRQRGAERRRRLPHSHLHDRHGPAGHDCSLGRGWRRPRACSSGFRTTRRLRTSTPRSSKGSTSTPQTAADVAPAFEGIQNQILRLTK